MSEKQAQLEKISNEVGNTWTPAEIEVVSRNVAKGADANELKYFLNTCKSVGLNPFNKEIWCYKDKQGNLIIFTGRDGLLRKAQENPVFAGMRSMEVCENDTFELDVANNRITHPIGMGSRGKIVGAYAIVFRKEGEPTIEWATTEDHKPGNVSLYSPWAKYEARMIKKVAEAHALKKAFGFAGGVQLEGDFEVENDTAKPLGKKDPETKEYSDIKQYIKDTNNVEGLEMIPDTKLEKFPDLKDQVEQKIDSLTINQDSDEV